MQSVSAVLAVGMIVGGVLGLVVGFLAAWAVFRARENQQIHNHVLEMTRTVTALVETSLKRREPKKPEEERSAT